MKKRIYLVILFLIGLYVWLNLYSYVSLGGNIYKINNLTRQECILHASDGLKNLVERC